MNEQIATLTHGSIEEILYILDTKELSNAEIRAAIINAFNHIQQLERRRL